MTALPGEVGRTGVAIDTIDDTPTAFDEMPLDHVSTLMTINAPPSVLLLLYELVGEEQGSPRSSFAARPRTTSSRSAASIAVMTSTTYSGDPEPTVLT